MAYDQSPPQGNLIWFFTGLTVVSLFALQLVFSSYFSVSTEAEISDKILTVEPTEYMEMKQQQQEALVSGKSPIDRVINTMAKRGMNGEVMQSMGISSEPSQNWAAVEGWTKEGQAHDAFSGPKAYSRLMGKSEGKLIDQGNLKKEENETTKDK